ncbi:hypothetical protein AGMMS49992_03680 [Clostridia bacterium]|nr:hypothetical protein AGMMS49992_03680 [Clostridia bacterium]
MICINELLPFDIKREQAAKDAFGKARWIGLPDGLGDRVTNLQCSMYRLRFDAPAGASMRLYVSAHTRYRLYLNGLPIMSGPCKGDRWRHFYEELDISDNLISGENVLAVNVVSHPPYEAQHGDQRAPSWTVARAVGPLLIVSGVLLDPSGAEFTNISTGIADWTARLNDARGWKLYPISHWMGSMESVDGSKYPHNWLMGEDQAQWLPAQTLNRPFDPMNTTFGIIPPFPLTARPIPPMYEIARQFTREMSLNHDDVPLIQFKDDKAIIPARSRQAIELDVGELTTAYFILRVNEGAGSTISIRYSEAYTSNKPGVPRKDIRDDTHERTLVGHEDSYQPGGGDETYSPFWFRTFRFVRIEVETADSPLTIHMPSMTETGYPLDVKTHISGSEPWLADLWDISARTLRRCMHDTYEDCPYYEQLQYIQDARLEMLFTYAVSGDTRMARRTIEDFHSSKHPSGMLMARFPTQEPHIIPPFSLHWIWMLEEYLQQTNDCDYIKHYRSTADAILEWYAEKIGGQGLAENLGYWDQIDWVDQWDSIAGRTPAAAVGPSTTHNLMYAYALEAAARVNDATGRPALAREYRERKAQICEQVDKLCWSESEGLYKEGPSYEEYSQHAQVYAVLCGIKRGADARKLLERALTKPGIAVGSLTWQYFLFRALESCDAYDLTLHQWPMWTQLLDKHLTTVPETPESMSSPRSDCHAWSALALYEFPRSLLGVKPDGYGWQGIIIKPYTLSFDHMDGTVITPHGMVSVNWRIENGLFILIAETPRGIPARVILPDSSAMNFDNGGVIHTSTRMRPQ